MSPSDQLENKSAFIVKAISINDETDFDAGIIVFDGHGKIMAEEIGIVKAQLPRGLYTIRIERFGETKEKVVIHREDTNLSILVPHRNSAMPSADTIHSHIAFRDAATKYSLESTFNQQGVNRNFPRLMIMVRKSDDNPASTIKLSSDFMLINENGKLITGFDSNYIKPAQSSSYIVYSARLRPGNYILAQYVGTQVQMLPITLHDKWDNFIFIPYENGPKFSMASIQMVRCNQGYDTNDKLAAQIDAALLGLGSRLDLMRSQVRRAAIYGKFSHPLIGLVGAYAHFMGDDRKEKLERQVLRNLWSLMRGSPDVLALLLISLSREDLELSLDKATFCDAAEEAFGERIDNFLPLTFPPILQTALEVILRATEIIPELVKQDSWLETAGNSSFGSGVWAVWAQPRTDMIHEPVLLAGAASSQMPSTQKLYPAVKRALGHMSKQSPRAISAQSPLGNIVAPSQEAYQLLVKDINEQLHGYQIKVSDPTGMENKTVRDLVNTIRIEARPAAIGSSIADKTQLKPLNNLETWLIEEVRELIDKKQFDAGKLAKKYGVSIHSIKRAASLKLGRRR